MSSAHQQIFIKGLTLTEINGQGFAVNQDLYDANGNKLDSVQLTGVDNNGDPHFAYTQTLVMLPKYNDYMFTALCTGCSVTAILEHSPDGIHWCDCALADGNTCTFKCDVTISRCTAKIVDVPLLQYVRVRLEEIPAETIDCSIMITHTMNY